MHGKFRKVPMPLHQLRLWFQFPVKETIKMVRRWSLSMRGVTAGSYNRRRRRRKHGGQALDSKAWRETTFQEETSLKQINSRSHDSTSVAETVRGVSELPEKSPFLYFWSGMCITDYIITCSVAWGRVICLLSVDLVSCWFSAVTQPQ